MPEREFEDMSDEELRALEVHFARILSGGEALAIVNLAAVRGVLFDRGKIQTKERKKRYA